MLSPFSPLQSSPDHPQEHLSPGCGLVDSHIVTGTNEGAQISRYIYIHAMLLSMQSR